MGISGELADANLVTMDNAVVQVDLVGDGASWNNIESWANEVQPTRGTIPTSTDPTLDGEQHLSTGAQEPSRVKVVALYDETATAPAPNLYPLLGESVDVRWSKSGSSGDIRYYTSGGKLVSCTPPGFSSKESGNTKIEFEIETAGDIEQETMVGTT